MARCLRSGNTFHFNRLCSIQRVLEVAQRPRGSGGDHREPEDKGLHGLENIELMEAGLSFSMVRCAGWGSRAIDFHGTGDILTRRIQQ
jgi:hypothetical protein